jgi:hypothetical protein
VNQDSDDDVDAFNDSQALPIPGEDQQRLLDFHKWRAVFSEDSTWQEFTDQCVEFASEARSLASYLIKPPVARVSNKDPAERDVLRMVVLLLDLTWLLLGGYKDFTDTRRNVQLGNSLMTIPSHMGAPWRMLIPILWMCLLRNVLMLVS